MKIQVFDPPMCCSTGVCGPAVDPGLIQFAADLEWLQDHGVEVERFNLSQQPQAFVTTTLVSELLAKEGNACLPLTLVNGTVVGKGSYPSRGTLARLANIALPESTAQAGTHSCCCGGSAPNRAGTGSGRSGNGCC